MAAVAALAHAAFGDGRGVRVAELHAEGSGGALPDSSRKLVVRDAGGAPIGFAHVSPPGAPGVVARDVARLSAARDALGDPLGRAVLAPLAHGAQGGVTAALYPFCAPLSGRGWAWRLQRPLVRRWGLAWLAGVARRTSAPVAPPAIDAAFAQPLERLAALDAVAPEVRGAARAALGRLRAGWRPRHVLMHGDLWKGNVVVRREGGTAGGRVPRADALALIDWGTSEVAGYGLFDLVRFAESVALRPSALRSEVVAHCRWLECDVADAAGHLLAALGFRAMHLEHFPPERFAAMAASCLRTLRGAA